MCVWREMRVKDCESEIRETSAGLVLAWDLDAGHDVRP